MGISVGDLQPERMDRLRGEIVEVLTAHYAYPAFFDFRAGQSAMRPVDRAKREEVDHFLRSVNFSALERTDITSPELRRFLERLLLRYIEVNPSLRGQRLIRRLPALRTHAARLAAEMQRGLTAHLEGKAPAFGAPRQHPSWATSGARGRRDSEGEHNTRVLEALLVRRDDAPAANEPSPPTSASPWGRSLADATIPVSATTGAPAGPATFSAPFAAFSASNGIAEVPTGPLGPPPARGAAESRSLPPDLMNLYGDYLRDMQPEMEASPPPPASLPPPVSLPPRSVPAANAGYGYDGARSRPDVSAPAAPAAPAAPMAAAGDGRSDKLIFWQLRYQLEAYVRRAAKSYGVRVSSGEPAGVLDALRRSGFVDEADLQLAEGILAITDRVTAAGTATTDDYRQALMLYLLYHRSHLGG
ncbi:MAG TPA: hypothetical protein VLJ14_07265 [Ktedonobacterales bacterium]|nr:hypothetical protein [Ktedonobacterales bacterium]